MQTWSFRKHLIETPYTAIFHDKMSGDTARFLQNTLYVSAGMIPGAIISFIFTILAARMLGPVEYGKFVLLQSVAMYLSIPLLFGMNNTIMKYVSETEDRGVQSRIISASYAIVAAFTAVSVLVYFLCSPYISGYFSIPLDIIHIAIIFAVLYAAYTILQNTLAGLSRVKAFALYQPLYSMTLLAAFILLVYLGITSFKSMAYAQFIAYGAMGLLILAISLRGYLTVSFRHIPLKPMAGYAVFSLIGCLAYTVYTNTDKIIMGRYLAIDTIGVYGAYSAISINLIFLFSGIFATVFFPMASKNKNRMEIYKKITRLIPWLIIVGVPVIVLVEYLALSLFGRRYPFDLFIAILFGLAGVTILVYNMQAYLMNAVGAGGARAVSISQITLAAFSIALNLILIPVSGIPGAVASMIVSYIIAYLILASRKMVFRNEEIST
jgi:O-antigen/teichoic acid export membrane protein